MTEAEERAQALWADEKADRLTESNARLVRVNQDWMQYTIGLLRHNDRLREENRSLMQTVRRVLRAKPVDER
jgi:hypothetical protein